MNEEDTLTKTQELISTATELLVQDGIEIAKAILMALIIFVFGKWIAGAIPNKLRSTMENREVDPALVSFGTSLAYYLLMIAVVLATVQQVGFQTTSLVALLGAAGLAVG